MPTKPQAEALDRLADGGWMSHNRLYGDAFAPASCLLHWRTVRALRTKGWVEPWWDSIAPYGYGTYHISEEGLRALKEYYANKTTG